MDNYQNIGRFRKSWLLTKAAWQGLKLDKELLSLPFIGLALSIPLLVIAGVGGAVFHNVFYASTTSYAYNSVTHSSSLTPAGYAGFAVIGLLMTGISTFISAAVVHGALERFSGGDPTVASSLRAARKRFGSLMAFSAFTWTIGAILNQIAQRVPFLGGRIVVWLADTAWNVASFFSIPVIVTSETAMNPLQATKRSFTIIKQVWGESLIVSATIGLISFVTTIVFVVLAVAVIAALTAAFNSALAFIFGAGLAVLGLITIAVVFSVLQGFVKAAIYYYAVTGQSPATFNQALMQQAFTVKRARRVFGA